MLSRGDGQKEDQLIHILCQNCGTFDIVGPGHPATTYVPHPDDPHNPEAGQHVLTDRTALKHAHAEDCEPHPETGHYPLAFTFMAGVGVTGAE
jgi:hypothetical protein